jgi:adenosylmethionine-8-amino-7-oxononanoate aminotransferase
MATLLTNLHEQIGPIARIPLPQKPTSILHRTPWRPPIAVSGKGIYITLEDGRTVIDGVGGAAVACIGNGHPEPVKAIKEQVDKVSCEVMS